MRESLIEASDVYYHGTDSKPFSRFDANKIGRTDVGLLGRGFYFSTDPAMGRNKKTLLTVRLNYSRPLTLSMPDWSTDKNDLVNDALGTSGLVGAPLTRELKRRGFDSVVLDYSPAGYRHREVVVFKSSQAHVSESLNEDEEQRRLRARPNPEQSLWSLYHNKGNGIVPARMMQRVPYAGSKVVTIYRGVRKSAEQVIRPGDWVGLTKRYAAQHGEGSVLSARVSAKDVVWAGTDMNEWFYVRSE